MDKASAFSPHLFPAQKKVFCEKKSQSIIVWQNNLVNI